MFNVAVIRLKDLVKYLIIVFVIIAIIVFGKRYFNKKTLEKINLGNVFSVNLSEKVKQAINIEIPETKQIEKQQDTTEIEESKFDEKELFTSLLGLELSAINAEEDKKQEIAKDDDKENDNQEKDNDKSAENKSEENEKVEEKDAKKDEKDESENKEDDVELAKKDVKTEVITKNPIADAYSQKYKSVKIKNETSYDLTDEDLNYDNLKIDKSNIIIFHTHTCESYTSSEKYDYTPTGNYRTTDLDYSVARVGDELTKYLEKYKFKVTHDKTYHDYPSYTGSYTRSLSTVTKILKTTKADIIIDLHRDAIGSYSSYAPTVKIGEDECAQLMFVMGTDGGKLKHPNWKNNLQFAIKMQETANNTYPGLFKPIILRNSRYNQHLGKAACIIEVGSTGNTLEQCLNSMKYLSEIFNEL